MSFPIPPPVEPMLAGLAEQIPGGGGFIYEPKWDGFRAIAFRGEGDVYIQSRDLRPLDRYFPELHEALLAALPDGCILDGEIVIASGEGLLRSARDGHAVRAGQSLRRRPPGTPLIRAWLRAADLIA